MSKKQNGNESVKANQKMSEIFKGYDPNNIIAANSDTESANQQIQQQFYGHEQQSNTLPFHVDINNTPIKK